MSEISMYDAQKKKMEGLCEEHDLVFSFKKDCYPIVFTIKPTSGMATRTAIKPAMMPDWQQRNRSPPLPL